MKKDASPVPEKLGHFLRKYHITIAFALLLLIGFYLRFWNIENTFEYGWDQARDAWKVRDILSGSLVLNGPRTGIGHFHLGSAWYYYLAPFYFLTRLDPIAAQYGNMLVCLFNCIVFFWVTKRIWGPKFALLSTYFFTISGYLITINKTAWNVSPVLGVSTLIFFCLHEIVMHRKYKLLVPLMFLTGLFIHLHFAFVFLPSIIFFSLLFAKDKKKIIQWGVVGLPLFLVMAIPLVFLDIEWKGGNTNLFQSFLKDYLIDGFHLRFFLIRIHDAFIQYQQILSIPHTVSWGKFVVPTIFTLVTLTERGQILKRNILLMIWFLVPAVVYSFYAGTTSEYYVLLNAPMVIYTLVYLIQKLMRVRGVWGVGITCGVAALLVFYGMRNSYDYWIKPSYGGLAKQKDETRNCIKAGCKKEYNEGFIDSYLYSIWTDPKYKNFPF